MSKALDYLISMRNEYLVARNTPPPFRPGVWASDPFEVVVEDLRRAILLLEKELSNAKPQTPPPTSPARQALTFADAIDLGNTAAKLLRETKHSAEAHEVALYMLRMAQEALDEFTTEENNQ